MSASVFDSPLYARLFPTGEAGRLFSDSAAIRAMLIVEGTLAKVQGTQGVIPEISAAAIQRASLEIGIDPGAIARATGENGVSVPGLVAAFRAEMNAPEHAQFVHWGATSQDIIDTGLMLRLRQLLNLLEDDLRAIIGALADGAEAHADTPMAARTYAQQAAPTSWGAVLADWGHGLYDLLETLPDLRTRSLLVSLSGAAGTASMLGIDPAATRAGLAEGLGLGDPGRSWHVDRGPITRIADWLCAVSAVLGRMGATLTALTATEVAEVTLQAFGASSTMPQKQNPVGPSTLHALAHTAAGLRTALAPATQHQHQRDGAAWFTEWMVLPQLCLGTASGTHIARALCEGMEPDTARMRANLDHSGGTIAAEALSFALAVALPRPEAQAEAKRLCRITAESGRSLREVALDAHPDIDPALFDPAKSLGQAPAEARAFVQRAHTTRA